MAIAIIATRKAIHVYLYIAPTGVRESIYERHICRACVRLVAFSAYIAARAKAYAYRLVSGSEVALVRGNNLTRGRIRPAQRPQIHAYYAH